jgi:hypothetical protein
MRGTLLVPDQDVMDAAVLQRVVYREDGTSRKTEYSRHALLFQTLPENLRACFHHGIFRPERIRPSSLMDGRLVQFKNRHEEAHPNGPWAILHALHNASNL